MAYVPFNAEDSQSKILTLNDYVESFGKKFPKEPIYLDVSSVRIDQRGFVLYTNQCSVFCSHKFRKIAKTLSGYAKAAASGESFCALAIGVPGTFNNDYADWYLAKNTDLIVTLVVDEKRSNEETTWLDVEILEDNSTDKPPSNEPDPYPPVPTAKSSKRTSYKAK